jgi:N6-adenosine-specific RNA methylase IME4
VSARLASLTLGAGQYRTIYADPPWRYGDGCQGRPVVGRERGSPTYDCLTVEDICRLPVGELGHAEGSLLFLWVTWPMLREAKPHRVMDAWGFRWVGEIVWEKPGLGIGRWLRPATEVLCLGERGVNCKELLYHAQKGSWKSEEGPVWTGDFDASLPVLFTPRRLGHSVKPDQFYPIMERLFDGPRIELFARRSREGWDRWGLEAPE